MGDVAVKILSVDADGSDDFILFDDAPAVVDGVVDARHELGHGLGDDTFEGRPHSDEHAMRAGMKRGDVADHAGLVAFDNLVGVVHLLCRCVFGCKRVRIGRQGICN